jgi:hypothetical protein
VEGEEVDLKRYLLGQMSEAEEARVERAYLGSDEALEELRAHEDELVEDYLANGLDAAENDRFERHFLASPGRLERLVFLRALADRAAAVEAAPPARRVARSWVPVAAGFAAVAVAGLLAARAVGPRPPLAQSPTPAPALPAASAPGRPAPVASAPAATATAPATVSVRLRAPALRGDVDVPLVDPGGGAEVVLELPLDPRDPYTAHRGRVTAPDGRDAFVSPWQPARGEPTLRVTVPASALRAGRHVLVVEGAGTGGEEPVESYAFRVRRR